MKKLFLLFALLPALALAGPHYELGTTWGVVHTPAAATKPTISVAATAGVRHIATAVTVCVNAVAAQAAPVVFNLRDGATGAGTILWTVSINAVAGTTNCVSSASLEIHGTVGVAMTLESVAAPAATNFATVALTGIDNPR